MKTLAKLAGLESRQLHPGRVTLNTHDGKALGLWWNRPVNLLEVGLAELAPSKGSGDIVSAARSDGFVEIPPNETGVGPYPYYTWNV